MTRLKEEKELNSEPMDGMFLMNTNGKDKHHPSLKSCLAI